MCGLRPDGSAVCWGDDEWGQASPPEGERFAAVSAGYSHTCGLRTDGSLLCWGENPLNQAPQLPKGERFTVVSSRVWDTCGLRPDGSLLCWGPLEDGLLRTYTPVEGLFAIGRVDIGR